jgi:hypothetical protein
MRKYVPKEMISWTPAATFRHMAKHIKSQDDAIKRTFEGCQRTESQLREYKMRQLSSRLSSQEQHLIRNVFGIEVATCEEPRPQG